MALQLTENFKGIDANYFKIIETKEDVINNLTIVILGLYKDKDSRDLDIKNYLKKETINITGLDYIREMLYVKIKESRLQVINKFNGTEFVEELVECNKFANAIDC